MTEKQKSGKHKDNDLDRVQQIMKDNDIPSFYTNGEDDEAESREQD